MLYQSRDNVFIGIIVLYIHPPHILKHESIQVPSQQYTGEAAL